MPKRRDLHTILIIGSGPVVVGQACEFDYAGTQACKALIEEGYRVVLINSSPASVMTDFNTACAIYIETIHWKTVANIIDKERPEAILPTMGGQTALNCALDLAREGILEQYQVELIGATKEAIDKAEDRLLFGQAMQNIGLQVPRSGLAHDINEAWEVQEKIGFPAIIRPSFTMGGSGGGIAYNRDEFLEICQRGLDLSPTNELLIDESIIGWKEYELELIRDQNDNCIVVCSIENLDPMGIHTGDSITIAPAQTLTDKEYQRLRRHAIAILREIGVETGGSNVQFGVNPEDGRVVVIEMNPRVSRSSALASKATGFPIAKVAAKLAVGFTLDELKNEITGQQIPASFEPTLDYVVTKVPRFNFDKFPQADDKLTTQMKSIGEVMAIGRTFQESLQKALRSLDNGMTGLNPQVDVDTETDQAKARIQQELRFPKAQRLWYVADAFRYGFNVDEVFKLCHIDPWYLEQIRELVAIEQSIQSMTLESIEAPFLFELKQKGFSDERIAQCLQTSESSVRKHRYQLGIRPVYKQIDTCAAEFATTTSYSYSTYEDENEVQPCERKKIMVLGSGPNRIGQGIEFDYCCVHAAMAIRELGMSAIMVNCNPETVSTDFDISDFLYFEPLTLENVLEIVAFERPEGVIVQYGGQTPLKLAQALEKSGVPIIGTTPFSINQAEDREQFQQLLHELDLLQPANGTVRSLEEGLRLSKVFAYPLVVRPSFVLGGQAMAVIYNEKELCRYMQEHPHFSAQNPLLLDHFLDDAIEVDVDALCDGKQVMIGGILEHIEQAGVHSGDSSCTMPPHSLNQAIQEQLREQISAMAKRLDVVGLVNAQFAIKDEKIYVLEVNPRASRTVPFISKATGLPLAKIGAKCMLGMSLEKQGFTPGFTPINHDYFAIKQAVFPWSKFPGVDPILGPQMHSTGEVMGIAKTFGQAFVKGVQGGMHDLPRQGCAFISVRDADKKKVLPIARQLLEQGFSLVCTKGTQQSLFQDGIVCTAVNKVTEGRPHIVDMIKNDEIQFIINTTEGEQAIADSLSIRCTAVAHKVFYTTTITGAQAAVEAMKYEAHYPVMSIQELHQADPNQPRQSPVNRLKELW